MVKDAVEMAHLRDALADEDAAEPLIAGEDADGDINEHDRTGPAQQTGAPLHRVSPVVWLLTISAGISGLLFGYDTGVISSTLVSIGSDLSHRQLTTTDKSLITAITSLFALFSAPATGYLADRHGRRSVILVANLLFIFGALVQAAAGTVSIMVAGRAAVGAAVGLASCATPLYITELAPAEMRGRLVTVQALFVTGGQVVAYLVGWAFAQQSSGWRWMVGLGALPALLQLVLLVFMFETPRWLVQAGQMNKARTVLLRIYGSLAEDDRRRTVECVIADVEEEIARETDIDEHCDAIAPSSRFMSTAQQLIFVPGNRRALTIACMLQGTQQLCGFNSLMYFSASIFMLVGFTNPIMTSLSVALTNFAMTVVVFAFIDAVGRRTILLASIPVMMLALCICSWAFAYVDLVPSIVQNNAQKDTGSAWSGILLGAMILYVAAYAIGLGCVPWQQSELFPLRVRSLGSGIATATNWTANTVIGISFLPMMELFSPSVTFLVYAAVCFLGWLGVWMIYPETAGLELESIGELLKDGWGVQRSLEGFRARKGKPSPDERQHRGVLSTLGNR